MTTVLEYMVMLLGEYLLVKYELLMVFILLSQHPGLFLYSHVTSCDDNCYNRHGRNAEGHSVIYHSSDVDMPESGVCGLDKKGIFDKLSSQTLPEEEHRRMKRAPFDSARTRCDLKVIVDVQYYNMTTNGLPNDPELKEAVVVGFIANYVDSVKEIYQRTDFDGIRDITFAISTLLIQTTPQAGFERPNLGVESFLELHSRENYDEFCLAYRFTARDFADGVLGLAYIGTSAAGSVGGICERHTRVNGLDKSLNTGIVTIVNYRREVPQLVVVLTFAHEIGHNFGSQVNTFAPMIGAL